MRTSENPYLLGTSVNRGRGPRRVLGTSPRPLRPGRPRPSAAGAVGLPGGGDPVLLAYRPAAVGLLHARLGHVYPTKPVGQRYPNCQHVLSRAERGPASNLERRPQPTRPRGRLVWRTSENPVQTKFAEHFFYDVDGWPPPASLRRCFLSEHLC